MKKSVYFLLISLVALGFYSCQKSLIEDDDPAIADSFKDLNVPPDFSWNNTHQAVINVNILDHQGNPSSSFDGEPIDITDMDGDRIDRMTIFDGNASFSVKLPFDVTSLKIYSPVYDVYQDLDLENTEVSFTMPQQRNDFSSLPDSDADKVPDIYDDFPNDAERAYGVSWPHEKSNRVWPSGQKYAYQIYEDLWPSTGDYDFNDFVFANKLDWQRGQGNKIVGGSVTTILWAVGGSIPHGLGMEVFSSNSPHNELTYMPDVTTFSGDGIQADPNVTNGVILFNNAFDVMTQNYNNNGSGPTSDPDTISLTYTLNYNTKDVEILTYLFKTSEPSNQIRTVGTPPTESANMALLGTGQDDSPASWDWTTGSSFSFPVSPSFYRTDLNHPWGIEFVTRDYEVAIEKISLIQAYPQFQGWAESGGANNQSWYDNPNSNKVFKFWN